MLEQEYFYTAEPKFKSVTREEFQEFLDKYPRKLDEHWSGICDPPSISYNDFKLADRWPHSTIAYTWDYDNTPFTYSEQEREFYVMDNYEEVFNSKTGNMVEDSLEDDEDEDEDIKVPSLDYKALKERFSTQLKDELEYMKKKFFEETGLQI